MKSIFTTLSSCKSAKSVLEFEELKAHSKSNDKKVDAGLFTDWMAISFDSLSSDKVTVGNTNVWLAVIIQKERMKHRKGKFLLIRSRWMILHIICNYPVKLSKTHAPENKFTLPFATADKRLCVGCLWEMLVEAVKKSAQSHRAEYSSSNFPDGTYSWKFELL